MKYYKLLTGTSLFKKGGYFNFTAKHALMYKLSFDEGRQVLWEEVTEEEALKHPELIVTHFNVHHEDHKLAAFYKANSNLH